MAGLSAAVEGEGQKSGATSFLDLFLEPLTVIST